MRWPSFLFSAALAVTASTAYGQALPRLASLSVCADQYVLTLAAPAQIAALSAQSRDPSLSHLAQRAASHRQILGTAEEILSLHPDIVVSDGYADMATQRLIERLGIRSLTLPDISDFEGLASALIFVARAIGRAEVGEQSAAALRSAVAKLRAEAPARRPHALYLLPTNSTAGRGTYVDAVLTLAGFINDAAERGIAGWRPLSLEALTVNPPRYVVASFVDRNREAVGMMARTNPALARISALAHPIEVPNALWPCAGPALIDAARYLHERLPP